jgi:hypothetical protein
MPAIRASRVLPAKREPVDLHPLTTHGTAAFTDVPMTGPEDT